MKLGQVLDFLVQIKKTGNKVGFTDKEIGKLNVVRIKNGIPVKQDFDMELVKVTGSGFVVLMTDKTEGGIITG